MTDVLIYGDTIRSPELRHEVSVPIPDPFLYAETGDRRIVVLQSLEIPRVRAEAPELEIIAPEQLGLDELYSQGLLGWEIPLELALRACREVGIVSASHGAQTAVGHNQGSGQIGPNEPIVFDLFPRDKTTGCYADMTRTYVVGEPTDEVREWHRLVKEALDESTRDVKPGANGRKLYEKVCDIFEAAGYKTQLSKEPGEVLEDGFFHGLGHGVGLEVHELPGLSRTGHDLVPGDVITIEPGLYRSGYGGLRLEDLVLVTKDGYEVITDYPYDLAP